MNSNKKFHFYYGNKWKRTSIMSLKLALILFNKDSFALKGCCLWIWSFFFFFTVLFCLGFCNNDHWSLYLVVMNGWLSPVCSCHSIFCRMIRLREKNIFWNDNDNRLVECAERAQNRCSDATILIQPCQITMHRFSKALAKIWGTHMLVCHTCCEGGGVEGGNTKWHLQPVHSWPSCETERGSLLHGWFLLPILAFQSRMCIASFWNGSWCVL